MMVRDKWTDAELRVVDRSHVQSQTLDGRGGEAGESAFSLSVGSTQECGGTEMSGGCTESVLVPVSKRLLHLAGVQDCYT